MRAATGGALVVVLCLCSGCISLARSEREDLRVIRDAGLSETEERIKFPPLAGALNVLPGGGNFYLAVSTDETDMWAIGFLNLLTWPLSIIWGIPEAAIDASTMNKRETIYYYMRTEKGRTKLQAAIDRRKTMPSIRP